MSDQHGPVKATGWAEKFEALFDKIPVLRGYLAKEKIRDADKILRDHTVGRMEAAKKEIESIKSRRVESGGLTMLDLLDKLTSRIDRVSNKHRFAAYGYSGYFDPQKIKEPELAAMLDYDAKILDLVESMAADATAWAKQSLADPDLKTKIMDFVEKLDQLEDFAGKRKEAFQRL